MIADDELQRILEAQPLFRMQQFAQLIGWNGLRLRHHRFRENDGVERPINPVVVWYETTNWKFCLNVNPYPQGQCRRFEATVQASRYRIWNVGWHVFELIGDEVQLRLEATRLDPWLQRRRFKDARWRRQLLVEHPDFRTPRADRRGLSHAPILDNPGGR